MKKYKAKKKKTELKSNKIKPNQTITFLWLKNNTKAVYVCTDRVRTNSFMTSGSNPFGAKDIETCDDVTVIRYVRLTFLRVLFSEKWW